MQSRCHAILSQTRCETIEICTASKADAAITTAMKNVYWLAKEEVATLKYSSLNVLLLEQGCQSMKDINVGQNAQYSAYHIVEEMQEAISSCIEEVIDKELQDSPFIGILIDESTDITTHKNLIVYAQFGTKVIMCPLTLYKTLKFMILQERAFIWK